MASITRSSRRAEGLHPHHGNPNSRSGPQAFPTGGGRRTKRILDVGTERDFEAIKPKKQRIAVEILAKPPATKAITDEAAPTKAARAPERRATPKPAPVNVATSQKTRAAGPASEEKKPAVPDSQDPNITKHQAKVINGIKHELDRLQPEANATTKEQGRKLRSQEATRFKSDLSAYFPDYDEMIGNEPKETHLLNVDTPIIIVDTGKPHASLIAGARTIPPQPHHNNDNGDFPVRAYGDALFTDVFDTQRIDFGFLETRYKNAAQEDPLPDSLFESVHRRAERTERSIRNSERGRAQHEKDQIIRLLEGLQGHDWLRVMGVSGVTETKKKTFEPARRHFIHGCQTILDKFRNWNLEEKRRKLEKERALAEQAESPDDDYVESSEKAEPVEEGEEDDEAAEDGNSQGESSEASSPAKQLREEAMARSKLSAKTTKKPRPRIQPAKQAKPPKPPEPPKEFKSFFTKKHERDGALNRHRRAGRKVLAWGHAVPDIVESDFLLPEEYRDEELLKTRARKKRRDRRESRN